MHIIVTGGAGYIGSFMVARLLEEGNTITVIDSFERGHKEIKHPSVIYQRGSLLDMNFLDKVFKEKYADGIIHFAAYISMGESMEKPGIYFSDNVTGSINLLETARAYSINNIIFSSTAGVYGNPIKIPIPEDHVKNPQNPYGESKLMVEHVLSWYQRIHNISYVCLRYFNACGASLDGSMGELHDPETHIIPNILRAVKNNSPFTLFGRDYKTADGTCVRDYIHVIDLVEAHVLALKFLSSSKGGYSLNVGTGKGYSNREVVEMVRKVTGKEVEVEYGPRRPGDADTLIADPTEIKKYLNFTPKYSDIETIVQSAWNWHKNI